MNLTTYTTEDLKTLLTYYHTQGNQAMISRLKDELLKR